MWKKASSKKQLEKISVFLGQNKILEKFGF
jgi:hypothetical protein